MARVYATDATRPEKKGSLIVPFATTWMDLETIVPTDGRETNMQYCLHVESKRRHSELPYGTETDPQTPLSSQQRTDSPRGRAGGEGMEWDLGISKLVCEEQINHKVLLWSTGKYFQQPARNHYEKTVYACVDRGVCVCVCVCVSLREECICMRRQRCVCVTESLCYIQQKLTPL